MADIGVTEVQPTESGVRAEPIEPAGSGEDEGQAPDVGDADADPGDGAAQAVEETVPEVADRPPAKRRIAWLRAMAFGVLPALALLLAIGIGFAKWQDSSARAADVAAIESVAAARDATVAILSYRPDSVEEELGAARDRLTGQFRDSYIQLTQDVVIPGAKQKQISAVATVPAAASVSASGKHAVVLVFVNQTTIVGQDAPTATASSVRVVLDKIGGRWLISGFDPI
ncbi:hypothetical protein DQP56_01160 [Mycolicibacter senuensis]|uniref:Mce associated membrane protein n=1 Tax=Mycolicibacter kumamotonensis TaxID=354243 RepID=A0A7K3L6V2_9MYCO|nr:hypothetical protein [Mycolicibacter kumamotonensis]RAV03981.1 hypothetical protein DQP56_01160 [Mycolicibacter senuensis]